MDKRSEYNRNYYIKNHEIIIQKHIEYYNQHREMINQRNKDFYINYYQQNKIKILSRVQNNYYNKIHAIKTYKEVIPKKNNIIVNNIIIRLMD